MLIVKKFQISTYEILGDMARTREALRKDGRTDVRTDGIHEAKTYIWLPHGKTYNNTLEQLIPHNAAH